MQYSTARPGLFRSGMIDFKRVLSVVACVLTWVSPLWAQTAPNTPEGWHGTATGSLAVYDLKQIIARTEASLRRKPRDFRALIVLSLTYTQMGRHRTAARIAGRAYRATRNGGQKLQAARTAAAARFSAGQFTRAEWWLRRAANHAVTRETAAIVQQEFRAVRRENPLSVRLGFSVAPSSNINGGSEEKSFYLGDTEFLFDPHSLALSGIEYAADANISYRLSQSQNQVTSAGVYIYGRTYSLTPATRALVPDMSGSDYALALVELSLRHRRLMFAGLGPTEFSLHSGQIWYGGDPLWRYNRLSLAQYFPISRNASAFMRASVEQQKALNNVQPNTLVYNLQGVYKQRLANKDVLQLSLTSRLNQADIATYTHRENRLTVQYNLAKPMLNASWSFSFAVGRKTYDEFSLSLNGRRDTYVILGATAVLDKVSYYGFSPSLSLSARRTKSNVTRFSTQGLQGRIGLQSKF